MLIGKRTGLVAGLVLVASLAGVGYGEDEPADRTPGASRFPSGQECAAAMTVPPGFEVQLMAAEPDVVNPIGMDFDHRGRLFVLECLEYPRKAPPGRKGRDRIRILEDTDGDGAADKVTTFAEGLNLATGIAIGRGGVFVGEAPELVFLEDTNGDDRADRRTVLLEGWGYQDTHETLNSFLWGPDGWLYGCHGVFTHSVVQGIPFSAAIWRYHPETKKFEIFAEGTSNPWGFDYDENGSSFLTACVIPHLFHVIPGGLYIRQAGQNRNPYAYGEIPEISDHRHFNPGGYRGSVDATTYGGGHAHAGCLVYQGGAYPEEYHGKVFMGNIHGSRINMDILTQRGSTFVGSHGPDFLLSNDPRFRAIQIRTGPDGSIYIIDWYDPQICHNTDPDAWEREHGRVYKVVYRGQGSGVRGQGKGHAAGGTGGLSASASASTSRKARADKPPVAPRRNVGKREGSEVGDLTKLSSEELVALLRHKNSWWWRKALLILDERGDKSVVPQLKEMVRKSDDYRHSLRALWALYNLEAFDEAFGRETLAHSNPWLRAWAVRLLGQLEGGLAAETWGQLVQLAVKDPSLDVRLQLASSCQRFATNRRSRLALEALMGRAEDANDPLIPFMIWIAYEPGLLPDYDRSLTWLAGRAAKNPVTRDHILPRALRRLVATGDAKHLDAAIACLGRIHSPETLTACLEALLESFRGRRLDPPPSWSEVQSHLSTIALLRPTPNASLSMQSQRLGIHFGDTRVVTKAESDAVSDKLGTQQRIEAVQALALARLRSSVRPLVDVAVADVPSELKREAIRALAGFEDKWIPTALLAHWDRFPPDLQREVVGLLSGRRPWAKWLLDAMLDGKVQRDALTDNDVRRMVALNDAELSAMVTKAWGKLREQTPEKLEEQLAKFRRNLAELPSDRAAGRAVFEKNCMVCHTLHGNGNQVGPDLTGANRRDPEYLLINVLDPNRVVGRDYYSAVVVDNSGRVHTGLVAEDTPQQVTLKGENAKLTVVPRSEIDEFRIEEKSLMPEGLPEAMTEQQFRDLVAFLMEDPYLDRGLVAGPFNAPLTLDFQFPIETAANPLKTEGVKWRPFHLGPNATMDIDKLGALAPASNSGAFICTEVVSPRPLETALELAADDGVKFWVNGREVARRENAFEMQRVPVQFEEGTNRLLFKVTNFYGPSWLRARLIDPERVLEVRRPAGD